MNSPHGLICDDTHNDPARTSITRIRFKVYRTLREWFRNMSPYEKLQAFKLKVPVLLGAIHKEFIAYYHRTNTFSSSIRSLIRTRRPDVKEVVQSTRLEQCTLPATAQEQYSTIEIGQDLIDKWKSRLYPSPFWCYPTSSHPSWSERTPAIAKVALLDSTYKKYSDSLIGALLTTLSNGSIQTQERNKIRKPLWLLSTIDCIRTLNHALDLSLPNSTTDALVAISNRADDTSIIQILADPQRRISPDYAYGMDKSGKLDDDEDDYSPPQPVSSRRSTRRWQPPPPPKKSSKDMSLAELMLETGHHDLVEKYFPNATPSTPPEPYSQPPIFTQPVPCIAMMHAYEHDFPPLERKYDQNTRVPSKPFVTPNTVDAQGSHSGSKGISINEPTFPPSTIPTSSSPEKLKQTVSSNPQPPSYSTVTSVPTSQTTSPPPTSSIGILQNSNPFSPLQDPSESQTESSSQDYSDDSSSRICRYLRNCNEQPDDNPPACDNNYKPTSGPWFTFDDLPYEKWRSRLHEFSAWIDLQTRTTDPARTSITRIRFKVYRTLREWFRTCLHMKNSKRFKLKVPLVLLGAIHKEFIGDFNLIRKEKSKNSLK
ncbi:hypothetical protein K1719_031193 [Acacia pycnantha]|nr:hypothetical protein K1719_031193 [Acacia pycnantha]